MSDLTGEPFEFPQLREDDETRWVVSPAVYRDIVARFGADYAAAHYLAWKYLPAGTEPAQNSDNKSDK